MRARSSLLRAIWISVPPVRRQIASTSCEQPVDFRLRAVELDDQHGFGLRKIRMDRRLGRLDRQPSIISTAAGMMPAAMISDTAAPAASVDCERRENRSHGLRHAQNPQRRPS